MKSVKCPISLGAVYRQGGDMPVVFKLVAR